MTPIMGLFWGYHHVKALGIPDQMDIPEFNLYKLVWEKNGVNFWSYVSVNLDFLGLVFELFGVYKIWKNRHFGSR